MSCRIGDTGDMLARGRISRVNEGAAALGVAPGDDVRAAAEKLAAAPLSSAPPPSIGEGRALIEGGARTIALVDSAAMVGPEDDGRIIVAGSHGGLVGGDPRMALRTQGFAAVFNDAGIGIERAGIARLAALEARGVPAFTVSADSCRIGDARSAFETGVISAVNPAAAARGAVVGGRAKALLLDWAGAAAPL